MKHQQQDQVLKELKAVLLSRFGKAFERYGLSLENILTPMKWRPLVLIVGNYSSGKSTFINEFVGKDCQRTGQAPTDDSFTIITATAPGEEERVIPGSTVVNDPELPFSGLRAFGQSLVSHLWLKKVDTPALQDLAIIDTPGMLDSVTEKDRGYNYLGVVGELARLSDCIVLMFDPHKAGTIKETYEAIRSTLPGATGEDRILYCLNRIDECDNIQDLVRSYGALCWNLSQMTGRKDMPRIYLTYSPEHISQKGIDVSPWENEREEILAVIKTAPTMRINHILQDADQTVRELGLLGEFFGNFKRTFWRQIRPTLKIGALCSVLAFFLGDVVTKLFFGTPHTTLLESILTGEAGLSNAFLPIFYAVLVTAIFILYSQRVFFPRFVKRTKEGPEGLLEFDTALKKDLWRKVRPKALAILDSRPQMLLWMRHEGVVARVNRFLNRELRDMFEKIS